MRKLLILLVALASIFCLAVSVSATCYEDYEIARLDQITEKTISYNPGGNNKVDGEIDGNLGTGVAPDWAGKDGINITYKYGKLHLVRSITITFDHDVGRGFDLEVSSDGGVTWTTVANVMPVEGDTLGKQTVTYTVNNGEGLHINAFKFTYRGSVVTYNLSLYEISITASTVLECAWDEGTAQVEGNCGVDGKVLHKCTKCSAEKTVTIPATGKHLWDEGVEILAPTESSNGTMKYTCTVCDSVKEEDISAIGHNWDEGTIVAPKCDEQGYTLYSCTDENCDATYQANYVNALGHSFDDGVETTHPTLTKEGVTTFSCVNEGCDEFYTESIPMATYDDSKIVIGLDNILSMTESLNNADKASSNRDPNGIFDGKITNGGQSDNAAKGAWFAPSGSSITITFDEEYFILSAKVFVWSNWNHYKIEFFDAQGNVILTHEDGKCQIMDGSGAEVANIYGKLVKSIKISSISAKGDSGNCMVIHELQIVAHKHLAEGETERYDEVIGCVENGSYKKFCYVCEKEVTVETMAYGSHDLEATVEFANGFDRVGNKTEICKRCDYEGKGRIQPIFVSYGYSVRETGSAAIVHKYEVNLESLEIFNSTLNAPLDFGIVAAAVPNFEGSPLVISEGAVAKANDKVALRSFANAGYVCFEYAISGIPEAAFDTSVVLCAYVFDGEKIIYLNANTDSGEAFETVSFNELCA